MNRITVALAALTMIGCSAKYNMVDVKRSSERLDKSSPVTVATPKDGFYSTTIYSGSGTETAGAVRAAFSRYTDNVKISPQCSDQQCLAKETNGVGYLVVPQILHWEDRATEWSSQPDKIEIKLSVYKASDLSLMSSIVINGASKLASLGGDHPQDLLASPINNYASSLY